MKGNQLITEIRELILVGKCSVSVQTWAFKLGGGGGGGEPPIFMKLGLARGIFLFSEAHGHNKAMCGKLPSSVQLSKRQWTKDNACKFFFFLAWIQRFVLISASAAPTA